MVNLLFWLLMVLNLGLLALAAVLGLAAARPSHTPMLQVLAFFALAAALLALLPLLYLRGPWRASRGVALVLAGLPAVVVLGGALLSRGAAGLLGVSPDDWGRPDPAQQQQVESAIGAGDAASVARVAAAPQARLNDGAALVAALRRLHTHPTELEPLSALLQAGVKPNSSGGPADPLAEGIRASRWAGPEPVRLLLDAGADPNRRQGSEPAWFAALTPGTHAAVLPLLLARGADLAVVDMAGATGVVRAAGHRNWSAVAVLVRSGARWRDVQMSDGRTLASVVGAERRRHPDDPELERLERLLR